MTSLESGRPIRAYERGLREAKPSTMLARHHRLAYITTLLPSVDSPSSRLGCPLYEQTTLSRGLHTAGLFQPRASVGSRGRTPGQFLMDPPTKFLSFDSYIRDLESHPAVMRTKSRLLLDGTTKVQGLSAVHPSINPVRAAVTYQLQANGPAFDS